MEEIWRKKQSDVVRFLLRVRYVMDRIVRTRDAAIHGGGMFGLI